MKFEVKKTNEKEPAIYKTLYIKQKLVGEIQDIANSNNTSWNNVVISMITACLSDE